MKEILQTNELKLQTACVEHPFMFYSCIAHVEHVGQDLVVTEEEETEVVCQEEEQQQFMESDQAEEVYQEEHQQFVCEDQEQVLEQDLTNFVDTQGKHRFIHPRVLHKFKFGASPGA